MYYGLDIGVRFPTEELVFLLRHIIQNGVNEIDDNAHR
jgi:hypothetical protein